MLSRAWPTQASLSPLDSSLRGGSPSIVIGVIQRPVSTGLALSVLLGFSVFQIGENFLQVGMEGEDGVGKVGF